MLRSINNNHTRELWFLDTVWQKIFEGENFHKLEVFMKLRGVPSFQLGFSNLQNFLGGNLTLSNL